MTNTNKGDILIVDDILPNLELLITLLTEHGYKVRPAINGHVALRAARKAPPSLILLDINMPDMDGYEVCRRLKSDERTSNIPIIFISGLGETLNKVQAFQVGGIDYITKPFQLPEVLARIETHLTLRNLQIELEQKNAQLQQEISERKQITIKVRQLNEELESRVLQRTAQLQTINQNLHKEIAERKHIQEQLTHMMYHDDLTGLPNRALLMRKLDEALAQTKIQPNNKFAVLFLDCDRFRLINNSLGHVIGKQVLVLLAERLESCLVSTTMLTRFEGDKFVILQVNVRSINLAQALAKKINNQLTKPFEINSHEIFINMSIGIVLGTSDYKQTEHILRDADTAMHMAKENKESDYQIFDESMHAKVVDLLQLVTDMRRALERHEFVVYYQPIVSLTTGKIIALEALTRWQHPKRGMLQPGMFIHEAEKTNIIVSIDQWVLHEACRQLQEWQKHSSINPSLKMSVNLSAKHFLQPDLINKIDHILHDTQISGANLKIEITEMTLMDCSKWVTERLYKLRERQIQLSIDDFGTGYSSLSYLHRLPVDILKIDYSFICRIGTDENNLEIVEAIITLAHSLGMQVVAEGVETDYQATKLKNLHCEYGQGFLFAEPLPKEAIEEMIIANYS